MALPGRVSAVMRRLALSAGALVAAVSFSSCSSVDSASTAAHVNGHRLTMDQLSALTNNSTDGDTIRTALTTWIEVVAVTDDASGMSTDVELSARKSVALKGLLGQFGDEARTTYALGLRGSPLLCLAAIPLADTVDSATVLAALAAGTTFAEAATTYSADPTLASTGGIVVSTDGVECIAADKFNPELIASLTQAGAEVGTPVTIELQAKKVVVMLRPYEELSLSDAELLQLSANEFGAALSKSYESSDISVAARLGSWDSAQGLVVAVGAPAAASE